MYILKTLTTNEYNTSSLTNQVYSPKVEFLVIYREFQNGYLREEGTFRKSLRSVSEGGTL